MVRDASGAANEVISSATDITASKTSVQTTIDQLHKRAVGDLETRIEKLLTGNFETVRPRNRHSGPAVGRCTGLDRSHR